MENNLQSQINEGEKRLRELIQKNEQVEGVLLKYQSGLISGHQLCESYHNLSKFIEDFSIFLRNFRDDLEKPRGIGGNRDAHYYRARKLHEQILTQIKKVQDLSGRVKDEMNSIKLNEKPKSTNWQTFDDENSRHDPLIDLSTNSSLQLHTDDNNTGQQQQQQQQQNYTEDERTLEDVRRIETDMLKINEMFTSLAGFVHEQAELTDRIEANVEVAYSKVESGNEQLSRAVSHKRKVTKKKIIIAVVGVVLLLLIILIIYLSVRN